LSVVFLPAAVIGAADGLAAQSATGQAFVLGQVVIEAGKRRKRPVAYRAVNTCIVFVFVAEHEGVKNS